MGDLSKYFNFSEMMVSDYAARNGINNTPPESAAACLKDLCADVLDVVRGHYGKPLVVTSGYRSPKVNSAIGGSKTSQHCFGQAADFTVLSVPLKQLFRDIGTGVIPVKFDQLIYEFDSWIHVSYVKNAKNRGQMLHAYTKNGSTIYAAITKQNLETWK